MEDVGKDQAAECSTIKCTVKSQCAMPMPEARTPPVRVPGSAQQRGASLTARLSPRWVKGLEPHAHLKASVE